VIVIAAGLAAYFTSSVTDAFKFVIAFGAGTGPVYILRWFWWRVNAWSEISAMIASSVLTVYLFSASGLHFRRALAGHHVRLGGGLAAGHALDQARATR
jgi:Na+/proline symporter